MLKIPPITKNLLIINVLAFVGLLVAQQVWGIDLNYVLGLHFFMASDFYLYQLVTYMFMHGGWEHIILNMFMLWMFGSVVERTWGEKRFLFYYILCGIGAGVMQEIAQFFYVYFMLDAQQPLGIVESFSVMRQLGDQLNNLTTVGASGAIYALLLAFGMMFPNEKMFIIPIPIPIKAKWMVMGAIVVELFSAMAVSNSNVAHLAHLGGMIFGFFLIRYWQKHPENYYNSSNGTSFFDNLKSKWEQRGGNRSFGNDSRYHDTGNSDWDYNARKQATQEEIDRILDKIRKSGYDSLSKEEKQTLFDQSKK
ncbi:rhomboid family intramembrane serine protease [Hallella colorans]|uniref:rhomboid family intramembrane serine protease n=1 Tax=Hallella colorans TaxID=1703337 RepID=UPI0023F3D31E|nr:rhomboid family intramembrane serine protease [Hallella colorans]